MKRLILFSFSILLFAINIMAKDNDLKISEMFSSKYVSDPAVSQLLLSGENSFLRKHDLILFATFRGPSATYVPIIKPILLEDSNSAESRNIRYQDGRLAYAFFSFPPSDKDEVIRQFVYYIDPIGKNKSDVMLIYFEGSITSGKAYRLISEIANPTQK